MPTAFVAVNASINVLIAVISILVNGVIIIAFAKTKSLHNVNNVFLIALATADIFKCVMLLPIKAYNQLTDQKTFNNSYCQLSGIIITMTTILGVLFLAAIATVRYYKVVQYGKFDVMFSRNRIILYTVCMVFATFVLAMLPILGAGKYTFSPFHGACFTSWAPENYLFRSLFYVYTIGLSYPVIIFCYGKIFLLLRQHHRQIAAHKAKNRQVVDTKDGANPGANGIRDGARGVNGAAISIAREMNTLMVALEIESTQNQATEITSTSPSLNLRAQACSNPSQLDDITEKQEQSSAREAAQPNEAAQSERQLSQRAQPNAAQAAKEVSSFSRRGTEKRLKMREKAQKTRKEIKVTKIMFMGVIAYAICWLPAFMTTVLFLTGVKKPTPTQLYTIVTLVELKMAINPLIYGVWNNQFRKAIVALLCRSR